MNRLEKSYSLIASITILSMVVSILPAGFSDSSDAAASITITDGYGTEFTFSDEPAHVITVGKGITSTVIQLGGIDKIVVADSYSKTDTDPVFDKLRQYITEGKITAGGNIYSSGKDQLQTEIVNAADTANGGLFNKETDPVIITGGNSYITPIKDYLVTNGFKKILLWNDITEYSKIPDFVDTVSKILTGSSSDKATQMRHVSQVIADGIEGHAKAEAFYVTYSGSAFKVGNINSLANSMIGAAGGTSITTDDTKAKPTYEASLTALMESHPNAVVFIDQSINGDASRLETLKSQVGADTKIVPLKPLWNNYSIESMNGVWTMACAMYPDLFSGDVPTVPGKTENNTLLYFGVGMAAAIIIVGVGFVFLRRH